MTHDSESGQATINYAGAIPRRARFDVPDMSRTNSSSRPIRSRSGTPAPSYPRVRFPSNCDAHHTRLTAKCWKHRRSGCSHGRDNVIAAIVGNHFTCKRSELGAHFIPGERILRIAFRIADELFHSLAVFGFDRDPGGPFGWEGFFDTWIFHHFNLLHEFTDLRRPNSADRELTEPSSPL